MPGPGPLYPQEKNSIPIVQVRMGLRARSGRMRKTSPIPGFDSWTVQPIASSCTDYTFPAQNRTKLPKGNLSLIRKGIADDRTVQDLEI